MTVALLAAALAHASEPVLVVPSPGIQVEAYTGLVQALRTDGHSVEVASFPCSGSVDAMREVLAQQARGRVVVAHGLGATLALQSDAEVRSWVLMAPVLGLPTSAAAQQALASLPSAPANLAADGEDDGLRDRLLGPGWAEFGTCVAPAVVDAWVQLGASGGRIPDLDGQGAPVWVGVSLLDELAPPERVIPLSRDLFERTVRRIGITAFDAKDCRHLEIPMDPAWIRAVRRAVRTGR